MDVGWGFFLSKPTVFEGRPLGRVRALSGLAIQTPLSSKPLFLELAPQALRGWGSITEATPSAEVMWASGTVTRQSAEGEQPSSSQPAVEQPAGKWSGGSHTDELRTREPTVRSKGEFSPFLSRLLSLDFLPLSFAVAQRCCSEVRPSEIR